MFQSSTIFKYLFRFNLNFKCDSSSSSSFCIRKYSKKIKGTIVTKSTKTATTAARAIEEQKHTIAFHKFQRIMDVPNGIFKGLMDRFNGVTIDSRQEFDKNDNFSDKLEKSLAYWIDNKFRGIWFKVYIENADWVPILAKQDFSFHHAKNGFVMMFKWLPKNECVNIPDYAHTMLGVGGLVVNNKNQVLAVSDRYALIPGSWKLPGGYVEPCENLIDATIREVREETGISSEFDTLLSLRHSHGGSFGCSDIYVVIALKPLTEELHRCEREIAKVDWIPIDEFLNHPNVHETNRQFVKEYLMYKKYGIKIDCEEKVHQILKKKYNLYAIKMLNQLNNDNSDKNGDE